MKTRVEKRITELEAERASIIAEIKKIVESEEGYYAVNNRLPFVILRNLASAGTRVNSSIVELKNLLNPL